MTVQEQILEQLKQGPQTDQELAQKLGKEWNAVRRRRQVLVNQALVRQAQPHEGDKVRRWELVPQAAEEPAQERQAS